MDFVKWVVKAVKQEASQDEQCAVVVAWAEFA
jgi:hypothetical protein